MVHWSQALTARLQGGVHMVGATIATNPAPAGPLAPPGSKARPQPRLRDHLLAFDHAALGTLRSTSDVLQCYANQMDAAWYSEAGAAAALLKAGHNLDCLMLRYQGHDWRDRSLWGWKAE